MGGGGLLQLLAYGAQDIYLGGGNYNKIVNYRNAKFTNRKYNNFKLFNVVIRQTDYQNNRNEVDYLLNEVIQNIFNTQIIDYPFSSFVLAKSKIHKFFKKIYNKPKITFYKVKYRRNESFNIEEVEETFDGEADFGCRVQCSITINNTTTI
jgi:hypothetical protein